MDPSNSWKLHFLRLISKKEKDGKQDCLQLTMERGAVSATPLFLFTSGDDKLNCSK